MGARAGSIIRCLFFLDCWSVPLAVYAPCRTHRDELLLAVQFLGGWWTHVVLLLASCYLMLRAAHYHHLTLFFFQLFVHFLCSVVHLTAHVSAPPPIRACSRCLLRTCPLCAHLGIRSLKRTSHINNNTTSDLSSVCVDPFCRSGKQIVSEEETLSSQQWALI